MDITVARPTARVFLEPVAGGFLHHKGSPRGGFFFVGRLPRPRFLSEPAGTSRPQAATTGRLEQEMKSTLEQIERDVGELKRKPATWGQGR